MDDLLIQGSDKGVEIDKGLRDLETKLGQLADGKTLEWKPKRPVPAEINAILLAKSEAQSDVDLAKFREEALATRDARAANVAQVSTLSAQLEERTVALENLNKEKETLAEEKREAAAKLDKMTEEFNRLFAASQGGGAEASP
jgi:chromosome segregation ATPase